MTKLFLLIATISLFFTPFAAQANYFDNCDFISGGAFPTGNITINTDTLTVDGVVWPNASVEMQSNGQDVALFTFDGGANITDNISIVGSLPAVLLFQGQAVISGTWNIDSGSTFDGTGKGGTPSNGGGGGGGFGGKGGQGGANPHGAGGNTYGDLLMALDAGSGGGGVLGGGNGKRLGGGGVEFGAIGHTTPLTPTL